ncbi:Holliday junction resolvase RuvX [Candidatus Woesearchaeota archaeon]|nr:MAG: Holliday junction resolvase RuvX [Candidatus Woesearchaeota archaeon]
MSILSIDPGTKKAGIAIAHYEVRIAFPYTTIRYKSKEEFLIKINKIIKKEKVKKIIIGNPIDLDGRSIKTLNKVYEIIEFLKEKVSIPVILIDERYTTKYVLRSMRNAGIKMEKFRKYRDTCSAVVILQDYLDRIESFKSC